MRFYILVLLMAAYGFQAHGRQDPNGCIANLVHEFNEEYVVESLTRVEAFWSVEFQRRGWPFHEIGYGLFKGSIETPCGNVRAEQGMFYCPLDFTVYLDPEYIHENLKLSGPALNWMFGFEFSHHVQAMLGVTEKVLGFYVTTVAADKLNEQADCLTGIYVQHLMSSGQMDPEQVQALKANFGPRIFWFNKGFHSRDASSCENFHRLAPLPSSSATSRLSR